VIYKADLKKIIKHNEIDTLETFLPNIVSSEISLEEFELLKA